MPKQIKSIRKNFRFTDQIAGILEDSAVNLNTSENELVSIAIFDFLSDNKKFIICPTCKNKTFIKQLIPAGDLLSLKCNCGTAIWYDPEQDKIVKSKKV